MKVARRSAQCSSPCFPLSVMHSVDIAIIVFPHLLAAGEWRKQRSKAVSSDSGVSPAIRKLGVHLTEDKSCLTAEC